MNMGRSETSESTVNANDARPSAEATKPTVPLPATRAPEMSTSRVSTMSMPPSARTVAAAESNRTRPTREDRISSVASPERESSVSPEPSRTKCPERTAVSGARSEKYDGLTPSPSISSV